MSSFRLRTAEADDAPAVASLVAALDVALLGSTDYTIADLVDEWRELAPANRWVALDGDRMVGYATVEETPSHVQTDGYVHPEHFGRGVGAFLVNELEQAAGERGARRVQTATLVEDRRAHALLAGHGYDEIRRFWHMRIALDREPAPPSWPEGLTATGFDPVDAEAFHTALESAFEDHWQHEPRPFDEWRRRNLHGDDFTPELWTVVRDGREIVAGTICVPERMGAGWIGRLVTARAWRRRGVGEALLHDAFGKFWRRGTRTVGLGVDAESDTGAQRLYERVGMHVHWSAVVFEKVLDARAA